MGGPGRGMMPGEKPKDFKNSIEKLVRYLGRYWYAIVAVMIFAAVSTVFSVAGPKVMARATNALVYIAMKWIINKPITQNLC